MGRRHFSVLFLFALLVAAAIALLVPVRTGHDEPGNKLQILEDMAASINDVNKLVFTAGGGAPVTTLEKGQSHWTISELHDYPADWNKVKGLLAGLAQAKVVEFKTSNPEYYPRLGVEDVKVSGAAGVLLDLSYGDESRALVIGNEATARGGQFLRPADQSQSVLIDHILDVSAEPMDWADNGVVDIGSGQVAELEILHPDGDLIRLSKVSADDTDFTLENLPEGREVLSSWSVNSMANLFSSLRMDGVKPALSPAPGDPVTVRLLMFSGLEIKAELFVLDERGWINISAVEPEQATVSGDDELRVLGAQDLQREAAGINMRSAGWLYRLPQLKHEAMTKRFEQLLKPLPTGQDTTE